MFDDVSYRFLAPSISCEYLPVQTCRMEYEYAPRLTKTIYARRIVEGWRRFGDTMFRPQCPACRACRSLRIAVDRFLPNRSQTRALRKNQEQTIVRFGEPSVDEARLSIYRRFQAHRAATRGWRTTAEDLENSQDAYVFSFLKNPFPTSEWTFEIDGRLAGVGFVDDLPIGLSAIYFMHDPDYLKRSLGIFNVLRLIEEARRRKLPHVYLGYHVEGCVSLAYKATFRPHELFDENGRWTEAFKPNL